MFNLYYKKNDNTALFNSLNDIGIYNVQNYIPLYKQFFSLKMTTYSGKKFVIIKILVHKYMLC